MRSAAEPLLPETTLPILRLLHLRILERCILWSVLTSVYQTVVSGPRLVRGGPQAVSEVKSLQKLYQTQRIKATPKHVCLKLPLCSDFHQKVRQIQLVIPATLLSYKHYFRKYFNLVCKMWLGLMVTLTNGIIFLLFTCMHFLVLGILRKRSACSPNACEVVRHCRKLENTDLTPVIVALM
jgi:hypothetical protein